MMNNTTTPKVTVSTTAPWTVTIDGAEVGPFKSRKAAREAAEKARQGATLDDIHTHAFDTMVDAVSADPRARRRTLKFSRGQLAAALGISVYQLDRVERGQLEATSNHISALL